MMRGAPRLGALSLRREAAGEERSLQGAGAGLETLAEKGAP
jgi:hypothetical protein